MRTLKIIFWLFPWVFLALCGYLVWNNWSAINFMPQAQTSETIIQTLVLERMEELGKLELTKYHFQEITEIQKVGRDFYSLFKLEGDSKAVLISNGEAVGCLDLTKMEVKDLQVAGDTLLVQLPAPEICYFKLDLEKTRVYALETGLFTSEKSFIERAYKSAENQILESALNSGILDQTKENAELVLKPLLEQLSQKKVILVYDITKVKITPQ
ncbi:MAG: DUF4230 domain-containing protein [Cyclobacteriaceae bacterium]|nr:DUF4230 domain-containing protein [Cyclobacteriaceae bacterium]